MEGYFGYKACSCCGKYADDGMMTEKIGIA